MGEGMTCYERDETLCEDQMCLRVGCRIRNERLSAASKMPAKAWLRVCGGGTRFPGHQGYVTITGDSIAAEGRTVYIRADLVEQMAAALRIIAGREQCIDNLMSNADVARAALSSWEAAQ